mmetsp:Transcript_5505/g.20081  ORF Transcript_5505/g.20081 Transcript_5505/m.20081 type:complete len:288 (-) Transcript_5505:230-1093(-)
MRHAGRSQRRGRDPGGVAEEGPLEHARRLLQGHRARAGAPELLRRGGLDAVDEGLPGDAGGQNLPERGDEGGVVAALAVLGRPGRVAEELHALRLVVPQEGRVVHEAPLRDGLRVAAHLAVAQHVVALPQSEGAAPALLRLLLDAAEDGRVQPPAPLHQVLRVAGSGPGQDGAGVQHEGGHHRALVDHHRAAAAEAAHHLHLAVADERQVQHLLGLARAAEHAGERHAVVDDEPVVVVRPQERLLQPQLRQHGQAPRAHHTQARGTPRARQHPSPHRRRACRRRRRR